MGLLSKLFSGSAMTDPVEGSARVVARSDHRGRGIKEIYTLHLVVHAQGIEPTAVEISPLVHRDRWPDPDMELPVTVDRANPARIDVKWEQVPSVTETPTPERGGRRRGDAQHRSALTATSRGDGSGWRTIAAWPSSATSRSRRGGILQRAALP